MPNAQSIERVSESKIENSTAETSKRLLEASVPAGARSSNRKSQDLPMELEFDNPYKNSHESHNAQANGEKANPQKDSIGKDGNTPKPKADAVPPAQAERTASPVKAEVAPTAERPAIKVDDSNRPTEIKYANGTQVKISRDATGNITQAEISGPNNSVNGTIKRNGDHFDRFSPAGKPTGETIDKVDIRPDGSASIHGRNAFAAGTKFVAKDGTVTQAIEF
ncbi:MAG: hypothetical protein K2X81_22735 [Candidatus Obscuribacterales bacterium]|nr:hypothetical protein [Candidatus Obscuribacterales bacterium]